MKANKEVTINYRKSGLYVLEFENGVKIGVSNNVHKRIYSYYKSPWCKPILRSTVFPHKTPQGVERNIKQNYKEYTDKGSTEFFIGVSFDTICDSIRRSNFKEEYIIKIPTYDYKEKYKGSTKAEIIDQLFKN